MQFNYAGQSHEGSAGRFYVELSLQPGLSATGELGRESQGELVQYFITPGVRYQWNLTPRTAVYGAAGAGTVIRTERVGVVTRK